MSFATNGANTATYRVLWRALAIILFLGALSGAAHSTSLLGASSGSRIEIWITACNSDIGGPFRILTGPVRGVATQPVAAMISVQGPGLYEARFTLSSGHYLIKVKGPHCSSTIAISVLPNAMRSLSLATDPPSFVDFTSRTAIAGKLPVPVSAAILLGEDKGARYLMIDHGAIYGENVPPRKYTLRLQFYDLQADIPIDMTSTPEGGVFDPHLTYAGVRSRLGYPLSNGGTEVPTFWQPR